MPVTKGHLWRQRREEKGWSQETAAGKAGISTNTVIGIEQGKDATYKTINLLAGALGIGESELPNYLEGTAVGATVAPDPLPHLSLHPYSGRWNFGVTCSRWEGRQLTQNESVFAEGFLDLLIRGDGRNGVGTAHGKLHLELLIGAEDGPAREYVGRLCVVDRVDQVCCCTPDGVLSFLSHTWARQPEPGTNEPPIGRDKRGPTNFRWTVRPGGEEGVLVGEYCVVAADPRDVATVRLERAPSL